jgi:integrase/recombinase XerD
MFRTDDHRRLASFLEYLERVGRADSTRLVYAQGVEDLLAAAECSLATLTASDLDAYLARWRTAFIEKNRRPPSPATYRNRVNALRAFYYWLERFDLLRDSDGAVVSNPMRWIDVPRVEQRTNDWLRATEAQALISALIPAHERFIVDLLRWTGLRVGEAVSLLISDVDLSPGNETIFVRESKTPAGRRAIPVFPVLVPALVERVHALTVDSPFIDVPLLLTRHRTPMKPSYVWRVVKRASFRAGVRVVPCLCQTDLSTQERGCPRTRTGEHLSRVSPHTLRRTFGSHLVNRGVRLEVVSRLLGHASTNVTERAYAELSLRNRET